MRRLESENGGCGDERFVTARAAVYNLGRHMISANHQRDLRVSAFAEWSRAVA